MCECSLSYKFVHWSVAGGVLLAAVCSSHCLAKKADRLPIARTVDPDQRSCTYQHIQYFPFSHMLHAGAYFAVSGCIFPFLSRVVSNQQLHRKRRCCMRFLVLRMNQDSQKGVLHFICHCLVHDLLLARLLALWRLDHGQRRQQR